MRERVKKYFLTGIYTLVLSIFSNSQTLQEETRQLISQKISLDSIYNFLIKKDITASLTLIKRKIDIGHKQVIGDVMYKKRGYEILIQEDNYGVYLAVINKRFRRNTKNLLFKTDSLRLSNYIAAHDSIYNSSSSTSLFKKFTLHRFGIACGDGGAPTPESEMMMQFISNKDTSSLRKWLKDQDYEIKVLGAIGLLVLQQRGINLNTADLEIATHLRKLNLPIFSCAGCTDWSPTSSALLLAKEAISYYKRP